jgi:hypothetical protein
MDSSFGPLDVFAFVVFAVLIAVVVVIVVSLGQLPGRLARKWGHPQASAINAASWIGVATGGLVWPLAFIWAFITPSSKIEDDQQAQGAVEPDKPATPDAPVSKHSADKEKRP